MRFIEASRYSKKLVFKLASLKNKITDKIICAVNIKNTTKYIIRIFLSPFLNQEHRKKTATFDIAFKSFFIFKQIKTNSF